MNKSYVGISILKSLILSYLLTGILLALLALAMYKTNLDVTYANLGVTLTYIVASLSCGFFIGKKIERRKFLWGFLLGLLYFIILFCISFLLHQNSQFITKERITSMLICLAGGTLGGMLS